MTFYRSTSVICCLLFWGTRVVADETPFPLGTSDLTPDPRFESFKGTTPVIDLEKAFEIETISQLDLDYETEEASELELLRKENARLKRRVAELERRLAAVEAKLGLESPLPTESVRTRALSSGFGWSEIPVGVLPLDGHSSESDGCSGSFWHSVGRHKCRTPTKTAR